MFSGGRCNTEYNLMLEFLPNKSHNLMGTLWIVAEGLVYLYATLILKYCTKNTEVLIWIGFIFNIIGTSL